MSTNVYGVAAETIELIKEAQAKEMPAGIRKDANITQSTGFSWYDLQAPARNVYPVVTPLRNSTPRVKGEGGTATRWRIVTALNPNNVAPYITEGTRNTFILPTVMEKLASYKSYGMEAAETFEAVYGAMNFEELRATTAMRLLQQTMIEEEKLILGGNASTSLGTPATPMLSNNGTGGSIAAGTYDCIVYGLTFDGYRYNSVASGITVAPSQTSADGSTTYTFNSGVSKQSAASNTTTTTGTTSTISATVTALPSAVAYAWFVGTAGAERLQAITTINSVKLTTLSSSTQIITDAKLGTSSTDYSANSLAFDGLLYSAFASGSNAYLATQPTGVAGLGTPLTSDGAAGIVEINTMLQSLWDNYRLSPTAIWVAGQELRNITNKIVAGGGSSLFRVALDSGTQPGGQLNLTGGMVVANYLNPFTVNGGQMIPLKLHPNLPAGTIMAVAEQLPYPVTNVRNVFEMKMRQDYYQIEWPLRTRRYETAVYADGVLAHYFPPSLGVISNIANG